MKKLFTLSLLALCFLSLTHAAIYEGTIGANLDWLVNTTSQQMFITKNNNQTISTLDGVIPDYSPATTRPWHQYRDSVTRLVLGEGVVAIGGYNFSHFTRLKTIVWPSTLTTIGGCSFYECTSLTTLVIPDGVKRIGYMAFSLCDSLTYVTLPSTDISISHQAFVRCPSMAEPIVHDTTLYALSSAYAAAHHCYRVPSSVRVIAEDCMQWGENLQWLKIPGSVKRIEEYVLYGATDLQYLFMDAVTPPVLDGKLLLDNQQRNEDGTFEYDTIQTKIYIPAGTLAAYRAAWGTGYNFVEGTMKDLVQSLPTPKTLLRYTDPQIRVATDQDTLQMTYGKEGYRILSEDIFYSDSLSVRIRYRMIDRYGQADAWQLSSRSYTNVDHIDMEAFSQLNAYDVEYSLRFDYYFPYTNSSGKRQQSIESKLSESALAQIQYPLIASAVDGEDSWRYFFYEVTGDAPYRQLKGYDFWYNYPSRSSEGYFRTGDTIAIGSDEMGTQSCMSHRVTLIDRAHALKPDGVSDAAYDSIVVPSEAGIFCGYVADRIVLPGAPFVVKGALSDVITYYICDEDWNIVQTVTASCGEAPVMPELTRDGDLLLGWICLSDKSAKVISTVPSSQYDIAYRPAWRSETAVDNVNAEHVAQKRLEDGRVVIYRDGVRYTVLGQKID